MTPGPLKLNISKTEYLCFSHHLISGYSITTFYLMRQKTQESSLRFLFALNFMSVFEQVGSVFQYVLDVLPLITYPSPFPWFTSKRGIFLRPLY